MFRKLMVVLCFLAFWSLPARSADWAIIDPDGDPVAGPMMFATNGTFPNEAPDQKCKVRIYRMINGDWTSLYYGEPGYMGVNWSYPYGGAVSGDYRVQLRTFEGVLKREVDFTFTSTM